MIYKYIVKVYKEIYKNIQNIQIYIYIYIYINKKKLKKKKIKYI